MILRIRILASFAIISKLEWEKESFYNIIGDYFWNNNLNLPLMPKLASSIPFLTTFITFSIQKPISSKINQ